MKTRRCCLQWLLLSCGAAACLALSGWLSYQWFYRLAPLRNLLDVEWLRNHSERAQWSEEQEHFHRTGEAPDFLAGLTRVGYYGDREWFQRMILRILEDDHYRYCGCSVTALSLISNQEFEEAKDWTEWHAAHAGETQEEWIRQGFARHGVHVSLPPGPLDTAPLLRLLGNSSTNEETRIPGHAKYNAFRWLRDSGFDPLAYALSNAPPAIDEDSRGRADAVSKI